MRDEPAGAYADVLEPPAVSLRWMIGYGFANVGFGALYIFNATVFPLFLASYTHNAILLGLLASSHSVEGMVIQPLVGRCSDGTRSRWGRRRPFTLAGVCVAAPFLILTQAAAHLDSSIRLAAMVACVFVFTAFANIAWDPYESLIADSSPASQRSRVLSVMMLWGFVGQVVLLLAPIPLAAKFWLTAALVLFPTLLTLARIRERVRPSVAKENRRSLWSGVTSLRELKQARYAFLGIFLIGGGTGAVVSNLALSMRHLTGASDAQVQLMFGALMVSSAVALIPAGWLAARIGDRNTVVVGLAITALASTGGLWVASPAAAYPMLALSGIGQACSDVALYPLLTQLVPREQIGFFTGLQSTASSLAGPVVIVIAGSLVNAGSYRAVFAVCIASMLVAMPLIARIDVRAAIREIAAR